MSGANAGSARRPAIAASGLGGGAVSIGDGALGVPPNRTHVLIQNIAQAFEASEADATARVSQRRRSVDNLG
jgi:hypothetical protein